LECGGRKVREMRFGVEEFWEEEGRNQKEFVVGN
jgi:hypothetical protein